MSCVNCTRAITQKKSEDEKILELAKQKAKDTGQSIALYRNEYGQLCISTNGEPIQHIITPNM